MTTAKVDFDLFYMKYSIRSIRVGLLMGILLYAVFGVWDYFVLTHSLKLAWIIRFGITLPVLLVVLALAYTSFFFQFYNTILVVASVVLTYSMMFMLYVSDRIQCYGLVISLFAINCLLRLRGGFALLATSLILTGYVVLACLQEELQNNPTVLINNIFFLFTSGAIGVYAAYSSELMARNIFQNREILKHDKELLSKAKEGLEISNSFKKKLLSIVSHDVKGPLGNISSLLLLCRKQLITRAEFDEHSLKLSNTVDNTVSLLESLLSWSITDNKNAASRVKPVNIHKAVADTVALMEQPVKRKNNKVLNLVDTDLVIDIDPTGVQLIIRNLLTNANKFTEGGIIFIRGNRITSDYCAISIEDTGTGMTKQFASNLFSWEQKLSSTGTQQERGTGIGLLICKECAESMGGTLDLVTHVGVGTTFTLTLPIHDASRCLTNVKEESSRLSSPQIVHQTTITTF